MVHKYLFVLMLFFSMTEISACVLEDTVLLGRTESSLGISKGEQLQDGALLLRELPADLLCEHDELWRDIDLTLLFVEGELAELRMERAGGGQKLYHWMLNTVSESERNKIDRTDDHDGRHHLYLMRGSSRHLRYQRHASGIEEIEFSDSERLRHRDTVLMKREVDR